jgi:hypothetical protein
MTNNLHPRNQQGVNLHRPWSSVHFYNFYFPLLWLIIKIVTGMPMTLFNWNCQRNYSGRENYRRMKSVCIWHRLLFLCLERPAYWWKGRYWLWANLLSGFSFEWTVVVWLYRCSLLAFLWSPILQFIICTLHLAWLLSVHVNIFVIRSNSDLVVVLFIYMVINVALIFFFHFLFKSSQLPRLVMLNVCHFLHYNNSNIIIIHDCKK